LDVRVAPWTVVIPVKALQHAKTRLAADVPTPADLAIAFLRDALASVLATPSVQRTVVVTADPVVAALAEKAGATVVDDSAHPGINRAAQHGAAHRAPGSAIAVIVSDLPCLTPGALTVALDAASGCRHAFLADLDGTGTTMWFAAAEAPVDPHFGLHSRAAHADAGAVDLVAAHPDLADALVRARLDIDTVAALDRAVDVGVGEATAAALHALRA
jgi:2-phospho-L-lactate guanylyltransferase